MGKQFGVALQLSAASVETLQKTPGEIVSAGLYSPAGRLSLFESGFVYFSQEVRGRDVHCVGVVGFVAVCGDTDPARNAALVSQNFI